MNIKKIIMLIIIPLLLNGCYDYQEITDLGIIVALGVDYQNNEFVITYEVLDDNKDKQSGLISSYTVTSSDTNLAKAFEKTSSKMAKKPYYSHIDIVLFGTSLAKDKFKDLTDYFLRNNDIREDFDVVIVDNPQKVLESTTLKQKVIGSSIVKAIKSDKYGIGISLEKKYSDITSEILAFGQDTIIPKINIINNDIILEGLALFNNYNLVSYLNTQDSSTYNLINNNAKNTILTNDNSFSIAIYNSKIDINMNNSINISGSVNAEILQNNPNYNIKNSQVLKELEEDFTNILNNNIVLLITKLQENNSDVLGLTNNYYKTNRIKNNKLWLYKDINSNVDLIISKKGIIYEVDEND